MISYEQNMPRKLDAAEKVYNFAKTKELSELIKGLEISKEDINFERESLLSTESIVTYSYWTSERGKAEKIILGRTYFSDDINGNQTFFFKLEGFPPILKDNVGKFLRSEELPKIELESCNYVPPKQQKPSYRYKGKRNNNCINVPLYNYTK